MKAKLGQNFLVSASAQQAIVAAAGNLREAVVLEIGPGRGAITEHLLRAARRVVAVEYDRGLSQGLAEKYAAAGNRVDVITNDILRVNLTALAEREGSRLIVVGNLPYYLTSDILLHLFAHAASLDRAVLMIQREVADRICAQPGTRDYGLLTVTTQLYAGIDRILELEPADFSPSPLVHSSVVRLHFLPRSSELNVEPEAFQAFLRKCFAQKRKTLGNNLRAGAYSQALLESACETAGISSQCRAETLSLEQFATLFVALR